MNEKLLEKTLSYRNNSLANYKLNMVFYQNLSDLNTI